MIVRVFLFQLILLFLSTIFLSVIGCKTSERDKLCVVSEYSTIRRFMERGLSGCSAQEILETREKLLRKNIPDYFGFKNAVDAYHEGQLSGRMIALGQELNALTNGTYSNLHETAYMDGLSENLMKRRGICDNAINWVVAVSHQRASFQKSYWERRSGMEFEGCSTFGCESCANEFCADYYEWLWRAYCRGYIDAFIMASKNGKFLFGQAYYCGVAAPSNKIEERAYVYGWWSGSYDCYRESMQPGSDVGVVLQCRRTINDYIYIEQQFWEEWQKNLTHELPNLIESCNDR